VTFGVLTAMSLLRCEIVFLVDGTNVSEEPAVYIFFPEDRGSKMF